MIWHIVGYTALNVFVLTCPGVHDSKRNGHRIPAELVWTWLIAVYAHFMAVYDSMAILWPGICSLVGRATTFVRSDRDVGPIPTCGALEVWQWTLWSRTGWLVNKSAGQPQFIVACTPLYHVMVPCTNHVMVPSTYHRQYEACSCLYQLVRVCTCTYWTRK